MAETEHLRAVRDAARKLKRGDQRRAQARAKELAALNAAIEAARAAGYQPRAIVKASGMPKASFYRLKDGQ
jgi:hypothetical protein